MLAVEFGPGSCTAGGIFPFAFLLCQSSLQCKVSCVIYAQKLTADMKLLEQDNELLKQKLDANKAR